MAASVTYFIKHFTAAGGYMAQMPTIWAATNKSYTNASTNYSGQDLMTHTIWVTWVGSSGSHP